MKDINDIVVDNVDDVCNMDEDVDDVCDVDEVDEDDVDEGYRGSGLSCCRFSEKLNLVAVL